MKTPLAFLRPLSLLLLAPVLALAQDRGSFDFAQIDGGVPPLSAQSPDSPPSLPSSPSRGLAVPPPAPGTIKLNFQNADLSAVLNYLSSTAGFIITQETPVTGTVTVVSQQPMTPDEAVDLLNTILDSKGYVAIRNGRILKIVAKQGAATRDLPVVTGADPAAIPRKDNMVTQILPVRYVPVGKLVDNLRPLLSNDASISSNDSSNAVLLTDTQTNIHRIAEIIKALDTSVSSISVIRVYTLRYADAKELADVITQLFTPGSSSSNNQQNGRGGFPNFPFFGGRGGGGNNGQQQAAAQPDSAALQAAQHVVAVADETTNSVVVSAPDEYMSAISDIVQKLDTNTTEVTETQIFKLLHADATELASSLTALYSDDTTANGAGAGNNNRGGNNNNRGFPGQPNNGASTGTPSERALAQARVIAVADPRTNSVLVNASHASMMQIAMLVGRLDASDTKKQHIYVHTLAHADPSNVANILSTMFNVSSSTTTFQGPTDIRLSNRSSTGLTTDAQSTLGGSGTSSSSSNSRSSSTGLH